jgi:hypothetical protein
MVFTIEQPDSSVLEYHPRMQELLGLITIFKVRFKMWAFGSPTDKPSIVYANRKWIGDLLQHKMNRHDEKPAKTLVDRFVASGETKYRGNTNLKCSQAYPDGFGKAMAEIFDRHKDDLQAESDQIQKKVEGMVPPNLEACVQHDAADPWSDASLDGVFEFIGSLC